MTFDDFVAARLPALLRHATVLSRDPYEAEDVVQDALINAQRHWARIARLDAPEAYVRRMIVNELISVRRRVRARLRRERSDPPEPVDDGAERLEQRDVLVRMIRQLPPRQRVVIALRYFEDLSDADIADVMGCGIANVRSQASRALATLREATLHHSATGRSS
jgi:RNA polymerase sigma-70 factor (sigma-E family)